MASIKKRGKKATQVGVILSFVIFITFLLFILVILKPSSQADNNKESNLEYLKSNVLDYTSEEIISIVLIPLPDENQDCYVFTESADIEEDFGVSSLSSSVLNYSLERVSSKNESEIIYVEGSFGSEIYKIKYSESEFENQEFTPGDCPGELQISSIKTRRQIFEKSINDLIAEQANNYEQLKDSFNLPEQRNFGISFEFENGTIVGNSLTEIQERKRTTYIKKFQENYIDNNAIEKIGEFTIYII